MQAKDLPQTSSPNTNPGQEEKVAHLRPLLKPAGLRPYLETHPSISLSISSELIRFLLKRLDEDSTRIELIQNSNEAIQQWEEADEQGKKSLIVSALQNMESLQCTITMLKLLLANIGYMLVSGRFSNMKALGYFLKKNEGEKNHSWSLRGIEAIMKLYYPGWINDIYYLCCQEDAPQDIAAILCNLQKNRPTFLMLTYANYPHFTLVSLQTIGKHLDIQVLDSIGSLPTEDPGDISINYPLAVLLESIWLKSKAETCEVKACTEHRQKDGANCAAFALRDFITATGLQNKDLFAGEPTEKFFFKKIKLTAYPKLAEPFYKISQYHILETYPLMRSVNTERGNPEALYTSIRALRAICEKKLRFKPAQQVFSDEEDKQEVDPRGRTPACTTM